MADITSSTYSVVTDSKSGDQYTIVRNGQLKKQTRTALDEHIVSVVNSPDEFTDLNDTPVSYAGSAGKTVKVNSSEDGLEFVDNGEVSDFTELDDTPNTYTGQALKRVRVNASEDGLEFTDPDTLVTEFTELDDTPSTYASQGLKLARVNAAETGIEFVQPDQEQVTGWASYADSTYTSGSPFVVTAGTTVDLPNNAATVINAHIPVGVTALYDGTVITPEKIGDAYEVRIDFTTSNSNVSGLADLVLDIGSPVGEILRRTFTFPKGSGTAFDYSTTTAIYTLDTFVANGGTIRINSITGDTSIWDIVYTIFRTHKGI